LPVSFPEQIIYRIVSYYCTNINILTHYGTDNVTQTHTHAHCIYNTDIMPYQPDKILQNGKYLSAA